jgi:hypothetical protein
MKVPEVVVLRIANLIHKIEYKKPSYDELDRKRVLDNLKKMVKFPSLILKDNTIGCVDLNGEVKCSYFLQALISLLQDSSIKDYKVETFDSLEYSFKNTNGFVVYDLGFKSFITVPESEYNVRDQIKLSDFMSSKNSFKYHKERESVHGEENMEEVYSLMQYVLDFPVLCHK